MDPLKPHTQRILEAEIARVQPKADPEGTKEHLALSNQRGLLDVDPGRILTGEIEVYDDRSRQPR